MSRDFASCCCVRCRAARSSCSGISLRSSSARRRASARASGDIFARSSLNFVVFGIVFFLHLGKVVVVNLIGQRHVLLVPAVIAGFVATQQQQRHAARIEHVKHPIWPPWCCTRSSRIAEWHEPLTPLLYGNGRWGP